FLLGRVGCGRVVFGLVRCGCVCPCRTRTRDLNSVRALGRASARGLVRGLVRVWGRLGVAPGGCAPATTPGTLPFRSGPCGWPFVSLRPPTGPHPWRGFYGVPIWPWPFGGPAAFLLGCAGRIRGLVPGVPSRPSTNSAFGLLRRQRFGTGCSTGCPPLAVSRSASGSGPAGLQTWTESPGSVLPVRRAARPGHVFVLGWAARCCLHEKRSSRPERSPRHRGLFSP